MSPIRHITSGYDVAEAQRQLENPAVWNRHRLRTEAYNTPHRAVSDIWVRFNDPALLDDPERFFGPHQAVWYPVVTDIPAIWALTRKVFRRVGGKELGGVLITKIPPGGRVEPHVDGGWHASYYEKFALQIQGHKEQAFCFEGAELRPETGDLYTFRNDVLHWVTNDSQIDRITCIICIKR